MLTLRHTWLNFTLIHWMQRRWGDEKHYALCCPAQLSCWQVFQFCVFFFSLWYWLYFYDALDTERNRSVTMQTSVVSEPGAFGVDCQSTPPQTHARTCNTHILIHTCTHTYYTHHNIFIFRRLSIVFCCLERTLPRKFGPVLYRHIKLVCLLTFFVLGFGSVFNASSHYVSNI